jgi:hypothetical protein
MRIALALLLLLLAPPVRASDEARDDFEARITATETARGLRFLVRPALERVAAGDERFAALRDAAPSDDPLRADGARSPARCLPDVERARILCAGEPEPGALRRALARLLDAQHHPALAARAPRLAGDPGVALRALLAASAEATASGGLGEPFAEEPPALLSLETLEVAHSPRTGELLVLAARALLRSVRDREEPFRSPPLSTRQLLSPPDYRAGVRPVRLDGAPPTVAGCEAAGDESLGVGRLLAALGARGGSVPGAALAGWRGDRLVRLACDDGASRWAYVADFDDSVGATAFAAHLDLLLPPDLARPAASLRQARRVVAWHGLGPAQARDWAARLAPVELRSLDDLE